MLSATPNMQSFITRRRQVLTWMHSLGGGVAVIPTAPERTRNRDNQYSYRHDSDFYYLTGFAQAQAWLVLVAGEVDQSIVFCEGKNPDVEIWTGLRWGPEAAAEHFFFDAGYDIKELDTLIPQLLIGQRNVISTLSRSAQPDLLKQLQNWLAAAKSTARDTRALPQHWLDLSEVLAEMRLVKDASELKTMRAAAAISAQAHLRAMQTARPGCHEYELEAELLYHFRKHGAQSVAYDSIVAGGANACILHHRAGDTVIHDGELVLIDAGCELDGYASDITRTFPINGRFSGPQRALYDIVLAAQHAAREKTSPQHHFNSGHDAAVQVLTQGLLDEGLLQGSLEQAIETAAYRPFYMHRTGHWLGMDVHDVGSYRSPLASDQERPWRMLQAGMVLTIEPGLYVRPTQGVAEKFWNIGIRIEDDAVITESGCELITRGVPVAPNEIEDLMDAR